MTVIVDSGLGNIGSVANMIRKLGERELRISREPAEILQADRLILPGVGHFDKGMSNLEKLGLIPVLTKKALSEKTPVLGICLGMQLMCRGSEEGRSPGLGWVDAYFKRFQFGDSTLKIPHMGWNWVRFIKETPVTEKLEGDQRFYFVHSYHMCTERPRDILATCDYGYSFPAAFHVENLYGVQFHPEKSHRFGMNLLSGFLRL